MDPGIHRVPGPDPAWSGAMDPGIHRVPGPDPAWFGAMDPGFHQGNRVWIRVSIAASSRAGAMKPGIHRGCGSPARGTPPAPRTETLAWVRTPDRGDLPCVTGFAALSQI